MAQDRSQVFMSFIEESGGNEAITRLCENAQKFIDEVNNPTYYNQLLWADETATADTISEYNCLIDVLLELKHHGYYIGAEVPERITSKFPFVYAYRQRDSTQVPITDIIETCLSYGCY